MIASASLHYPEPVQGTNAWAQCRVITDALAESFGRTDTSAAISLMAGGGGPLHALCRYETPGSDDPTIASVVFRSAERLLSSDRGTPADPPFCAAAMTV